MLSRLVEGPLSEDPRICAALLAVEAATAAAGNNQTNGGADKGDEANGLEGTERARAAAKRVLAVRRESLALWGAYAQLEAQAGHRKVNTHPSCHANAPGSVVEPVSLAKLSIWLPECTVCPRFCSRRCCYDTYPLPAWEGSNAEKRMTAMISKGHAMWYLRCPIPCNAHATFCA